MTDPREVRMTTTDREVETIAAGLTKAQKDVLVAAWPYPDYHHHGEQISYCPVAINARNEAALNRLGLAATKASGGPRLTPFGLAVRAHLASQERDKA